MLSPQALHEPKRQPLREGEVPHGSGATHPQTQPSSRTTEAASVPGPVAVPPVETTDAEDLNTEKSR